VDLQQPEEWTTAAHCTRVSLFPSHWMRRGCELCVGKHVPALATKGAHLGGQLPQALLAIDCSRVMEAQGCFV
jgi:hypothetical protein